MSDQAADGWVDADAVAKDASGKKAALIGGKWQPVDEYAINPKDINPQTGRPRAKAFIRAGKPAAVAAQAPRQPAVGSYMDPMHQAAQEATGDSNLLRTLKPDFAAHPLDTVRDITAGIDIPFRAVGNAVMDATGSPLWAAGAYTVSQALSPAIGIKLAQRAIRLGKIAANQAEDFAKLLSKRIAEEGKTGWNPSAPVTDAQIDKIAKELQKGKEPSKPIKSPEQKAASKRTIPAGEEGFPAEASNLDDIPTGRVEPTIQTEPALPTRPEIDMGTLPNDPVTEFPKATYPEVPDVRPEPKPVGTKPVKPKRGTIADEGGRIDPFIAAHIASAGVGGAVGAAVDPDHPMQGAVLGAILGGSVGHYVTVRVTPRSFVDGVEKALNPGAQLNLNRNAEIASRIDNAERARAQLASAKIPEERFFPFVQAIESGDFSALSPQEKSVAQLFMQAVGQLGSKAQEAGLIPNLRKNFVPKIFDTDDKATQATLKKLGYDLKAQERVRGFSTFTPHQLEQTITSYETARRLGLKPATMKVDELFGRYANSVIRATVNKEAITRLKSLRTPEGPLVGMRGEKGVGPDWVPINHGDTNVAELNDMLVHPDIADSVSVGFSSYSPYVLARAAISINYFTKRLQTAYSFFHPNSLLEAADAQMITLNPLKPVESVKSIGKAAGIPLGMAARGTEKVVRKLGWEGFEIPYRSALDKALDKWRQGSESVDILVRNGLMKSSTLEDRGGFDAMQKALKWTGQVPGLGTLSKGAAGIDRAFNKFTWDYVQNGTKIMNADALFQAEVQRDMVAAAKEGRDPTPINKIAADVAAHINTTAGGIDWYRMAEGVQNKFGRQIALFAATPRGQAYMSMFNYAPDWTVSTLAPWLKTMGLSGNEATQRYANNYILKSLVIELVVANGFNYKNTGHFIWDNNFRKDKRGREREQTTFEKLNDMTYVDRGDGTKQQMFKHLNEFLHLLTEPDKFVANKTSNLIKDPIEVVTNQKYLSAHRAPPISPESDSETVGFFKRLGWPFYQSLPIVGQQGLTGGKGSGIWGFLGRPIYGISDEEKQKQKDSR